MAIVWSPLCLISSSRRDRCSPNQPTNQPSNPPPTKQPGSQPDLSQRMIEDREKVVRNVWRSSDAHHLSLKQVFQRAKRFENQKVQNQENQKMQNLEENQHSTQSWEILDILMKRMCEVFFKLSSMCYHLKLRCVLISILIKTNVVGIWLSVILGPVATLPNHPWTHSCTNSDQFRLAERNKKIRPTVSTNSQQAALFVICCTFSCP